MENFPEIPKLEIPENFGIPIPFLEYPRVEPLQFDPIFVPQTVDPGTVEDLLQDLRDLATEENLEEEAEQEENPGEENSQEEKKDQKEKKEHSDKAPDTNTLPLPKLPNLELPPIQTTPIEVPSLMEDDDDSFPESELEGVTIIQVLGFPIPMPAPEILVAAGTTATVSVAATLATTSILKKVISIMKPLIKKIMTLVLKKFGKKPPKSWARERLEQRLGKQPKKG